VSHSLVGICCHRRALQCSWLCSAAGSVVAAPKELERYYYY